MILLLSWCKKKGGTERVSEYVPLVQICFVGWMDLRNKQKPIPLGGDFTHS